MKTRIVYQLNKLVDRLNFNLRNKSTAHSRVIVAVASWRNFLGCLLVFASSLLSFLKPSVAPNTSYLVRASGFLLWKRCFRTLLQWLCTVVCRISTFLIHLFRVTGNTSSLHVSVWVFYVAFWQILKAWPIRALLAGVNNEVISGSMSETNEWWRIVHVLSFHTCEVMIIYIHLMQTQLMFMLLVNFLIFRK